MRTSSFLMTLGSLVLRCVGPQVSDMASSTWTSLWWGGVERGRSLVHPSTLETQPRTWDVRKGAGVHLGVGERVFSLKKVKLQGR